jgi:glutathione S-transferase
MFDDTPVLTYFPIRGRAEPIRLLLEDAQIKYEDHRNFNWQQEKPNRDKYPFGQLPCMSFGSLHIVQQDAILRHLAREHNYYGTLPEEMADADMIAGAVEDLKGPYGKAIYGGDFVSMNEADEIRKMRLDRFWKRMPNLG